MAVSASMLVLAILGCSGTVLATNHAHVNEELNEILHNLDVADSNQNFRKNSLINHHNLRSADENALKSDLNLRSDDDDEEVSTEEEDESQLGAAFPFLPNNCNAWIPNSPLVPCPSGVGQCMTVCVNGCGGYPGFLGQGYPHNNQHGINGGGFPPNRFPPQINGNNGGILNPHVVQQIIPGGNGAPGGCGGRDGIGCPNGGFDISNGNHGIPAGNPFPQNQYDVVQAQNANQAIAANAGDFLPGVIHGYPGSNGGSLNALQDQSQAVNVGCPGGNTCQGGAHAFQSQSQTQVGGNGAQSQNQGQTLKAGRGASQSQAQSQTQARTRAAQLQNQARTHIGRTVFNPKTIPTRNNIRLRIYA